MRVFRDNKPSIEYDTAILRHITSALNKKILNNPKLRFVEVSAYVIDNDIRPEYSRKKREYVGDVYIDQLTDSESLTYEIIERKIKDINVYLRERVSSCVVGFFVTTNDLFDGWVYVDVVLSSCKEIPNFQRF